MDSSPPREPPSPELLPHTIIFYPGSSREQLQLDATFFPALLFLPRSKMLKAPMDILKMLGDVRSEHSQLEGAIIAVERVSLGRGKRRGRPPENGCRHRRMAPRNEMQMPKKRTVRRQRKKGSRRS